MSNGLLLLLRSGRLLKQYDAHAVLPVLPSIVQIAKKGIKEGFKEDFMKKVCVISIYLTEERIKYIREACEAAGYEVAFFDNWEQAAEEAKDANIVCSPGPEALFGMKDLEWAHSTNAGAEPYVKSGLFDSGRVILTNSAGAYGLAMAEHVVMVTLMLFRQMPEYMKIVSERGWKQRLPIRSIYGSRVAIAGTGGVGSLVAKKMKALEAAEVIGFNRSGREVEGFDKIYKISEIDSHLGDLDLLVMCLPGTAETDGLLSEERLGKLPETAYIVNVGRGKTIDQDALIDALNEGRIAGAALDVMYPEPLPKDHPLWTAKNCIITPHSSGDTGLPYSVDNTFGIFCENVGRYARGEELVNVVSVKDGY